MSEEMRKLAEQLRQEAQRHTAIKREKSAQVLVAATGLELLRQKLGVRNG